ncbi:MAG: twin-arginine translocation signal domain-containing protein [Gammaproteobacteria bacterium]|nr:twin-arginine translocation signal domain-containing protein [Gammaproteobacteria bacterium]
MNQKTTRRNFLKSTAAIPAGAAMASSAGLALAANKQEQQQAQIEYLSLVLQKYTLTSETVQQSDIADFATRFTQQHGVVAYQAEFGGVPGHARLVKLFVQNRHPGVISYQAAVAAKV